MYKIYRIVDNTNGNVYIGQTIQTLKVRLLRHKNDYKTGGHTCSSRDIIKNGDYRIELIEETDDKSRERYWIENTDCVNERIPGRTKKEYYQDNKEKKKEYDKNKNKFFTSMGGTPWHNNNSLLKIDPDLFN
tara:strand:- start:670 stop:1065 length:396 start_codon:yes stop_codon:yes gene_type:complete